MNPEIKNRLISALESGKYKQTTGSLNRVAKPENAPVEIGYCCLGVMCELAVEDGIISREVEGAFGHYGTEDEFEENLYGESMPPRSVAEWAGIGKDSDSSIYFDLTDREDSLSEVAEIQSWMKTRIPGKIVIGAHELNDEFAYSFQDIADLLKSDDRIVEPTW